MTHKTNRGVTRIWKASASFFQTTITGLCCPATMEASIMTWITISKLSHHIDLSPSSLPLLSSPSSWLFSKTSLPLMTITSSMLSFCSIILLRCATLSINQKQGRGGGMNMDVYGISIGSTLPPLLSFALFLRDSSTSSSLLFLFSRVYGSVVAISCASFALGSFLFSISYMMKQRLQLHHDQQQAEETNTDGQKEEKKKSGDKICINTPKKNENTTASTKNEISIVKVTTCLFLLFVLIITLLQHFIPYPDNNDSIEEKNENTSMTLWTMTALIQLIFMLLYPLLISTSNISRQRAIFTPGEYIVLSSLFTVLWMDYLLHNTKLSSFLKMTSNMYHPPIHMAVAQAGLLGTIFGCILASFFFGRTTTTTAITERKRKSNNKLKLMKSNGTANLVLVQIGIFVLSVLCFVYPVLTTYCHSTSASFQTYQKESWCIKQNTFRTENYSLLIKMKNWFMVSFEWIHSFLFSSDNYHFLLKMEEIDGRNAWTKRTLILDAATSSTNNGLTRLFGWIDSILQQQSSSPPRWFNLINWSIILMLSMPIAIRTAMKLKQQKSEQKQYHHRIVVVARKYFHIIAVLLFTPVTHVSSTMMSFSYAIAIALLLLLESLRCCVVTSSTVSASTKIVSSNSKKRNLHHVNAQDEVIVEKEEINNGKVLNGKRTKIPNQPLSCNPSNGKKASKGCVQKSKGFTLNDFYEAFFDEKDSTTTATATVEKMTNKKNDIANGSASGNFVVTHAALVFGCAIPLWMGEIVFACIPIVLDDERVEAVKEGMRCTMIINHCLLKESLSSSQSQYVSLKLLPYIGIIVVGVGDAVGAVVGTLYGKYRWPGGSKRTIEGSIAMLMSMFLFIFLIDLVIYQSKWVDALESLFSIGCWRPAVILMLLEASTSQIDNLCLPLVGAFLLLIECVQ